MVMPDSMLALNIFIFVNFVFVQHEKPKFKFVKLLTIIIKKRDLMPLIPVSTGIKMFCKK